MKLLLTTSHIVQPFYTARTPCNSNKIRTRIDKNEGDKWDQAGLLSSNLVIGPSLCLPNNLEDEDTPLTLDQTKEVAANHSIPTNLRRDDKVEAEAVVATSRRNADSLAAAVVEENDNDSRAGYN